MKEYSKGFKLLEKKCGNDRDNVISLATISVQSNTEGKPIPAVRNVNAYYEEGVFYIVTYGKSNKMIEIDNNQEVAFSVDRKNITGNGVAKNLGWVLDPKNAELRIKLRKVFAQWYDEANNEEDENFCYCAIHITKATVVTGHGPTTTRYQLDFINKKELDEVRLLSEREAYSFKFKGYQAIEEGRAYISKFLEENEIKLTEQNEIIYIFGSYNLKQISSELLEYTLYFILPERIKLKKTLTKEMVFGGLYARRFTRFGNLELSREDLYQTFADHPSYETEGTIVEQYLLDKSKISKSTKVLQLLSLKMK